MNFEEIIKESPYIVGVNIRPAITETGSVTIEAAGITLINRGNTLVKINTELTLDPGQSWSVSTQFYDIIRQTFEIQFGAVNLIDPPAVINNRLEVVLINRGKSLSSCDV